MWRMLIILLIVGLCVNTASALPGSGTQQDPWRIESLADFDEFSADPDYWDGYTHLETDINLTGRIYSAAIIAPDTGGAEGFQGTALTGVFDGKDHKITGLTIYDLGASKDYRGLFGYIDKGEVRNLGLEGCDVSGRFGVGGLVGENSWGFVSNCYSIGSVSGRGLIGGLVGNNDGVVLNCYSTGSVGGDNSVGGLVGINYGGFVSKCYSKCDVNGDRDVGGLVGYNSGNVSNCYSNGDVSGHEEVGGLVGLNSHIVSNCFWDTDTQTHNITESIGLNYEGTVTNVSGLTTIEMQTKIIFIDAGWDFIGERDNGTTETWQMPTGGGYPILSVFQIDIPVPLVGSGTAIEPYLVSDANELGMVSWYPGGCHFKLTGDVDISGIHWTVAVVPAFDGCFDGDGHKVIDMEISGGGHLGLFGYLRNKGRIMNLCIDGGSVSGSSSYVGGLVGYNWYGSISNCYSTVDVIGDMAVGGLVGRNWYGWISNCYSTGNVGGISSSVGGLVGDNWYSSVLNCYSIGDVSGDIRVGGLIGSDSGNVSNCYSTGDVTGSSCVGGLMGWNSNSSSNCYSTGCVRGDDHVGGLVGVNTGGVSNCLWDTDTQIHGVTESIGLNYGGTIKNVSGFTTAEMWTQSTFVDAGWDFIGERQNGTTESWLMPAGGGYPILSIFCIDIPTPLAGSGTAGEPYLVGDANELGMVSWYPADCHFKLTSDIDLSGINWSVAVAPIFTGCFDGDGHRVLNMQISGCGYLGLIGYLRNKGTIRNLCIDGGFVSGNGSNIGGVVGSNWDGSVSNCYSIGSVSGHRETGGLVGSNRGSILNCYSTGSVKGDWCVGGLVGDNRGSISKCYSTDDVNGEGHVGGLVGDNWGSISNCYSIGDVNGYREVGGLVGKNREIISDCYSTGDVCGTGWSIGGLVGCNFDSVSNCFWDIDTQTHGVHYSIGENSSTVINVAGLRTSLMQTRSTFTSAGWDFTTPVWTIDEGVDYPRLWWEFVPVLHAEPDVTLGTGNTISWEAVVGGIEYYAECAEDASFTSIIHSTGWITETSYEFTGLQLGQRYWYIVKARNSAGMESQWSNVESSLQCTLAEAVEIILDPNNLKSENLKESYINKINTAQEMIDSGSLTSALNKFENDILQKTNGCGETGEPDKNDWIITCEEQSQVYSLIVETIEYVKSLME